MISYTGKGQVDVEQECRHVGYSNTLSQNMIDTICFPAFLIKTVMGARKSTAFDKLQGTEA